MDAHATTIRLTTGRRLLPLLLTGLSLAGMPWRAALATAGEPLAPRIANYRIEARLDPATRTLRGHQRLRWLNDTAKPARELRFHFYLNAFAGNRTTLMRANPSLVESWANRYPGEWGGIEVTTLRIGETDVKDKLEFVRPDDGNPEDRTVARLPLARAVQPGQGIEVTMDFVARLPRVFLRTGHAAPFFMVAQWYPKVGVFENGSWNCHQYHATSEFYADFGRYEVRLTVPDGFVVGHTGVAVAEHENGDGTKTIEVRAEDVHDFAWVADPRFRVIEREVAGTKVRLLMQPNHVGQSERYFDILHATLAFYRKWFGPYPYPVLTVVDPGPGAHMANGMEYPMLFTAGTTWWMPAQLRLPELLVVHEFGHQYWYGVVANDEVGSAWLDEGVNSFVEGRVMEEIYGAGRGYFDWLGLRIGATAKNRFLYLAAATHGPITRPAYSMLDWTSYRAVSYAKTALLLETLERRFGSEPLLAALGSYYRQWRFRHPTGADWRASLRESLGEEVNEFLVPALDGTNTLDYAVTRVAVRKIAPAAGLESSRRESERQPAETLYRSEVVVERRGGVQTPVEIVVGLEDQTSTRETWDGRDRWRRLEIVSRQRAQYAEVDPERRLPLDVDMLNNSRMRSAGTRGVVRLAARWGIWLQGALHLLTAF